MQKIGELIFNSAIFVVSCALYYVATTFPDYRNSDQVGPALWPKMILLTIMILSGTLMVKNGKRMLDSIRSSERPASIQQGGNRMLIAAVTLSLVYVFSVSYVGFLVSIFLFQIIFLLILRVRSLKTLILYPACLTVTVYAIFIKLLYIPLPRGSGFFLAISRIFY
ncbi:MAG: tripartite tricarboxylate transporter TctB family protein [Thermodesulfobacteriota bacterium]